jgi:hypothetical protein
LGARPHDPIGADIDRDLIGGVASSGKGLHLDDLADPDIETEEIVVGCLRFQLDHVEDSADKESLPASLNHPGGAVIPQDRPKPHFVPTNR